MNFDSNLSNEELLELYNTLLEEEEIHEQIKIEEAEKDVK